VKLELRAMTKQLAKTRESRDDLLYEAVGKIVLFRVAAHILEWQHGDRSQPRVWRMR
jgi:hypothetical protein